MEIRFNPKGGISSMKDKRTGKELLESKKRSALPAELKVRTSNPGGSGLWRVRGAERRGLWHAKAV